MYRQYENPRALEEELKKEKERQAQKVAEGYELDGDDYERLADLEERVNFAWQDEEYDMEESEHYTPSATHGDYSPSCPWKAPGMSISDFI